MLSDPVCACIQKINNLDSSDNCALSAHGERVMGGHTKQVMTGTWKRLAGVFIIHFLDLLMWVKARARQLQTGRQHCYCYRHGYSSVSPTGRLRVWRGKAGRLAQVGQTDHLHCRLLSMSVCYEMVLSEIRILVI